MPTLPFSLQSFKLTCHTRLYIYPALRFLDTVQRLYSLSASPRNSRVNIPCHKLVCKHGGRTGNVGVGTALIQILGVGWSLFLHVPKLYRIFFSIKNQNLKIFSTRHFFPVLWATFLAVVYSGTWVVCYTTTAVNILVNGWHFWRKP